MNESSNPITRNSQPSLKDLMARYLSPDNSTNILNSSQQGEVEPYDVSSGFRVSTFTTWQEVISATKLLGVQPERLSQPTEWSVYSASVQSPNLIPFGAGLFPQQVRGLPSLETNTKLTTRAISQVSQFVGVRSWIQKTLKSRTVSQLLIASGIAANLGDERTAQEALESAKLHDSERGQTFWVNQKACLELLRGEPLAAQKLLADRTDAASSFNLGVAALSLGHKAAASEHFQHAGKLLPESSGWFHLAQMYLLLAQS